MNDDTKKKLKLQCNNNDNNTKKIIKRISQHIHISIDFSWLNDEGIEVFVWLFEFIYATIWVVKME